MTIVRVVGLTGGIGCGKSSAADVLRSDGIPVLDTDQVAHRLLEPGTTGLMKVLSEFGDHFAVDGRLDRARLGEWVFNRPEELKKLNDIVHPMVFEEMHQWLKSTLAHHEHAVVMIPLLFETGAEQWCDRVMVVAADESVVFSRLESRGMGRQAARARMQAQMALPDKISRADVVVWNNGSLEELAAHVRTGWQHLTIGKEAKK